MNYQGQEPHCHREEDDISIEFAEPIYEIGSLDEKNNEENCCLLHNIRGNRRRYSSESKQSLFVQLNLRDQFRFFSILDYEVYYITDKYKNDIYKICKYPDIIWKYIETNAISEESLKQVDDDAKLLADLDAIHCDDSNIRLKISHYCLKNPSKYLPGTQLVNEQYDTKLREWLGSDYDWKLLYRSSEHDYRAKSFHECCDDKGPTLIVIKSSGGWIFGGYTTQSWNGGWWGIYNDLIY